MKKSDTSHLQIAGILLMLFGIYMITPMSTESFDDIKSIIKPANIGDTGSGSHKIEMVYDNKIVNPYTKMGDEIIDGQLYPDLSRWSGAVIPTPTGIQNQFGYSVLELKSNYTQDVRDWNSVYFASRLESDYMYPKVMMEAYVYVPQASYDRGVIIEMNPEIFFSADKGNNNIFALFRLVVTPQGVGLRYVGENDIVYTAVPSITNFRPDGWNKISLIVDFKTQRYISMSVNDVTYNEKYFTHKFTVRPGNGAGSSKSLIGFWVGNKAYNGMQGTPIYFGKITVVTTIPTSQYFSIGDRISWNTGGQIIGKITAVNNLQYKVFVERSENPDYPVGSTVLLGKSTSGITKVTASPSVSGFASILSLVGLVSMHLITYKIKW